ncbi:MAG: hypothetical protein M1827_001401 [Pycnora praestabilis]|nr:MAG: hypothetical protein M1827_001401 [Pycnora praestabilis]
MSTFSLPSIATVPSLSTMDRASILDHLFEPCVPLHTLSVGLIHEETFASYDDLIAAIAMQLTDLSESSSTSDKEWLEKILRAHPRLGEKSVDSAQSREEQAQLNAGAESEAQDLRIYNEEYERMFPGLRYVVFVNGRSRPEIMKDMKHRIMTSNIKAEHSAAIKAMCEIAADRASKMTTTQS